MMKMHVWTALLCAAVAAPVTAQEVPAEPIPSAETKPDAAFADAQPVEDGKLAKIAGREDVLQANLSDQANTVEGNEVGDNSVTGGIEISDAAFSRMNGMTIVNANTGNNAAINAAIQVNIALPSE